MTDEETDESILMLRDDLDSPGPAEYRTSRQELALIDAAIDQAHATQPRRVRWLRALPWTGGFSLVFGGVAAAAWVGSVFSPEPPKLEEKDLAQEPESAPDISPVLQQEPAAEQPEETPEASEHAPKTAPAPRASGEALPKPPEDLLAKASQLRAEGKLGEAERVYESLLKQRPSGSTAYVARVALAQLQAGRAPDAARQQLLLARKQQPAGALDPEISRLLASTYRAQGNSEAEARELRRLVTKHPGGAVGDEARRRLEELGAAGP